MVTISIINYKGGVGKTTTTANLAGELAFRGFNILMIDLDPQSSLTFSFITSEDWKEKFAENKTIKSWFKPSRRTPITDFNNLIINLEKGLDGKLDLVASHLELINVDLELATLLGGSNLRQSKQKFLRVHSMLLGGIKDLTKGSYDYVIIDCPPNFNIVTKNAIVASNHLLIPARPDYLSTIGIDYLIKSMESLIKEFNDYCDVQDEEDVAKIDPQIAGVIFTMVQLYGNEPIATMRKYIAQTKEIKIESKNVNVNVFDQYIRENKTLYAEAAEKLEPVVLSNHQRSDIINELVKLVDEIETKIKP
jgi:chromosome partitioning protein